MSTRKTDIMDALRDNDLEKIEAVLRGQPAVLHTFLQEKNDLRYANWFSGLGATWLQLAAFVRPDAARTLVEMGAELDLHAACALGDVDAIGACLAADPAALHHQVDSYYPIQYALRHLDAGDNILALRYLLEQGEDADRPLRKAAWYEWEDQAAARGLSEWRPIHLVAFRGNIEASVEAAAVLHAFGADLQAVSSPFGQTALHLSAVYNGHLLIRWLVDNGTAVDIGNTRKRQSSAATDLFDTSSYLPFDTWDQTPLMLALGEGQPQAVEALLDLGADVDVRDSGGFTPLHYAAGAFYGENTAHVDLLLQRGATNQANAEGRRPIDLARRKNYPAVVALLEKAI